MADLVVANPTFAASGSATLGHTERVIAAAAKEDVLSQWLFDVTDPANVLEFDGRW